MPADGATGDAGRPCHAVSPRGFAAGARGVGDVARNRATMGDMDAPALDVLTALLSLVSAVGVLVVNGKVDRLTGRVDNLTGRASG